MRLIAYKNIMQESFPFTIQIKDHTTLNSPIHAHEYFQICYVQKGSCIHHLRGKTVVLVKGDLFSIPPMYEHKLETLPGHDIEIVHIDFLPTLMDRHMADLFDMDSFIDFAFIQPFVQLNDTLLPKLNVSYARQRIIEELINEMLEEFAYKSAGYELIIKSGLQKLLVLAGREFLNYTEKAEEHRIIHLHRDHLEQALSYIEQHYTDNLKLQDVAAKAAMSPSYFTSIFKLIKGMTFIDYVNEIRLNEAVRLLKGHPELSIERIAELSGFNHVTHFYRMFKRKLGIPPAQFRRN
ncbi:AraC family transcriptional regulator [Paenibacillus thalictri]|nr:AraC family transcriptional regulator [Paenibacillus thalictri]